MQKSIEQADEWDAIWERRGALDAFIDWGRMVYNWFFRRVLRKYLKKDSSMLELGCGRASLSLSLAPSLGNLRGLDISEPAVRQAAERAATLGLNNASFCLDDCTKLACEDRFDFVWSQGLLEHFDDPTMVAREHFRMLAPGGVALMSVPYKYSYHTLWYLLTRPKMLRKFWPWTEQRFFSKRELLALGRSITPTAHAFLLQPFPLGIVFLELSRPQTQK